MSLNDPRAWLCQCSVTDIQITLGKPDYIMRVFNHRYWPHQVHVPRGHDQNVYAQIQQLERYCYDHFHSGNWRNHGLYFVFKRHADATMFALTQLAR